MTATPPFRTPPATKGAARAVAAPAAPALGVCTTDGHRQRSAFFRFFSLLRITSLVMPIASTTTNAMAMSASAPETSMAPMQVFLLWLVMFSACLLAVVIFHWVVVPLFGWIERRFF